VKYTKEELYRLSKCITGEYEMQRLALKWCGDNIEGIARRERLPDIRRSTTGKTSVAGHEFYVTVGMFDDAEPSTARPGEIFVKAAKHGSDMSLFVDAWATMVSVALQYGVPWSKVYKKCEHANGSTSDETSPSFLHAIVVMADKLIKEYRSEYANIIAEPTFSEKLKDASDLADAGLHEQTNKQGEVPGTGKMAFATAPASESGEDGSLSRPAPEDPPIESTSYAPEAGSGVENRWRCRVQMDDLSWGESFYVDAMDWKTAAQIAAFNASDGGMGARGKLSPEYEEVLVHVASPEGNRSNVMVSVWIDCEVGGADHSPFDEE